MKNVNVFIFRRDLRIQDNLALHTLIQDNLPIIPIFIFNPLQIDSRKNPYFGNNALQFMLESLSDLKHATGNALKFFHGYDIQVLDSLLKLYKINAVGFNTDFTSFAQQRDGQINKWCTIHSIRLVTEEDYTLFPMKTILLDSGKPYEVFTPFMKKCIKKNVVIQKPITTDKTSKIFINDKHLQSISNIYQFLNKPSNPNLAMKGGRFHALELLDRVKSGYFKDYEKSRNYPGLDKTTRLSPYLKFGCISIRELYDTIKNAYGSHHSLLTELYWREFYANITFHRPDIIKPYSNMKNSAFHVKYNNFPWQYNNEYYQKWCTGTTGYPIVDAAMRQLLTTGWMHNRCRMIVAMFLTKDLIIDWREGERFFAQHLIDYDPSSNSGGWQWSSSQGNDAAPYWRIFNPWLQMQRFDPETKYIKKWIPELRHVPPKDILKWDETFQKWDVSYPAPMVNHKDQAAKVISLYQKY